MFNRTEHSKIKHSTHKGQPRKSTVLFLCRQAERSDQSWTKPREKTREELTAEIEESKKKIRQFENREKIIKQKLSVEERKARTHRLCKRGGFMESLVPELIAMPDEDAKAFLRLALTSEPAQEFLKKRAGDGNAE